MPEPGSHGPQRERDSRSPVRRTLVLPIVTELVPVLEPVGRDPFIDGPDDLVRCLPRRHEQEVDLASALVTAR
jgi:hypothetical protein